MSRSSFFDVPGMDPDINVGQGVITVNGYFDTDAFVEEGQIVAVSRSAGVPYSWEPLASLPAPAGPLSPLWGGPYTVPLGLMMETSGTKEPDQYGPGNKMKLRAVQVAGSAGVLNVGDKIVRNGHKLIVGPTKDFLKLAFYPVHPLVFRPGYNDTLGELLKNCTGSKIMEKAGQFADLYCPWFTRIPLFVAMGQMAEDEKGYNLKADLDAEMNAMDKIAGVRVGHPFEAETALLRDTNDMDEFLDVAEDAYESMVTRLVCGTALCDAGLGQKMTVLLRH